LDVAKAQQALAYPETTENVLARQQAQATLSTAQATLEVNNSGADSVASQQAIRDAASAQAALSKTLAAQAPAEFAPIHSANEAYFNAQATLAQAKIDLANAETNVAQNPSKANSQAFSDARFAVGEAIGNVVTTKGAVLDVSARDANAAGGLGHDTIAEFEAKTGQESSQENVASALDSGIRAGNSADNEAAVARFSGESDLEGDIVGNLEKAPSLPGDVPLLALPPADESSVIDGEFSGGVQTDEPALEPQSETIVAVKDEASSDPAQQLTKRAQDLQVKEMLARIRGDAKGLAEIVAERGQVQTQRQALALDGRISQIEDMKGELASKSTLDDAKEAARQKLQQDVEYKADQKALAEALRAGNEDEITRLTTKLDGMVEKGALEALDRAAAERGVLADRAENLANGGRDWSAKEVEERTAARAAEISKLREESSSDPSKAAELAKAIDNLDSTRARVDQAIKDAKELRAMAGEQSRLYEDQAKALKDVDQATKLRDKWKAQAEVRKLGDQIERMQLTATSLVAGRTIEQLGRSDPKTLSASDALRLAQARYDQAVSDARLGLMDAGRRPGDTLSRADQAKIDSLRKVVGSAAEVVRNEILVTQANKLVDKQIQAKEVADKALDQAKIKAASLQSKISDLRERLSKLGDENVSDARQRATIQAIGEYLNDIRSGRLTGLTLDERINKLTDESENSQSGKDSKADPQLVDDLNKRLDNASRDATNDLEVARMAADLATKDLDLAKAQLEKLKADQNGSWLDQAKAGYDVWSAERAVSYAQDESINARAQARAERSGNSGDIESYKNALRLVDEYRRVTGKQMDPEVIVRMSQIGNSLELVGGAETGKSVEVQYKKGASLSDQKLLDQINDVFRAYEDIANGEKDKGIRLELKQAKSILESFKNSSVLLEMATGFGKTTTVLPLQGVLTRLILGDSIKKVVLVFTDNAKATDAFGENVAQKLFEKYKAEIGGVGLINEETVGHGNTEKALEIAKDSGILFVTRSALKTLKLNTETAKGDELTVSKQTYDLITQDTHGIFDEAHELPDTSHLILGRDGVKVTDAHPQIVDAMVKVDSWLSSIREAQETELGSAIDNKTFFNWLEDGGDGRFIETKQGLRISNDAVDQYLAYRNGLMNTNISMADFLNNDEYIPERASLISVTSAIGATVGSDYAKLTDAKGHENDKPIRIIPVAEGKANAEMRFGDPYEAAAKQLVGARRWYDSSEDVRTLLEEATTNDKAVRVTDASVINDFATKTLVTGTGKSVGDAMAFGLGIESPDSAPLFTRYKPGNENGGGENVIVGDELRYGATISQVYDEAFRIKDGSVAGPDSNLNYVVGNEATDIHSYDSINEFGDRFGETHNLVYKIGDRMFLGDAKGNVIAELDNETFSKLLLPTDEKSVNQLGDIGDPTKRVAIYLDQGAVTGTDMKLEFFKLTGDGSSASDKAAAALAKKTVFMNIFGEDTTLSRAGQALGRDRMYGRAGDDNNPTMAHTKMILMVGDSYKGVIDANGNGDPSKFVDVLTQRENEARNARVQKTISDSLQEAMVNRFRFMTENATSDAERAAINEARTEFQSETSVNSDLTAPLTQKAYDSVQAEIAKMQDTFAKTVRAELSKLSEANQNFFRIADAARVTFDPHGSGVFVIENGYVTGLKAGVYFERGLSSMDFAEAVHTINEKFNRADFSIDSSHPRSSYASVMAAESDIRKTIDQLQPPSQGGEAGSETNGAGQGKTPRGPGGIPSRTPDSVPSGIGAYAASSSPRTIPVTPQVQPATQSGVAVMDAPEESSLLLVGQVMSPAVITPAATLPDARRSLTIPELYALRAQAVVAYQQGGLKVPPLVAAVAGAGSLQDVAQLLYSQAGVQAPSGSLTASGSVGQWVNAIYSNENSFAHQRWQMFRQTTAQVARSGAQNIGWNWNGLKAIKGMALVALSPLMGAVAAIMSQGLKSADKVSVLMNAVGKLPGVLPLLRSLAVSKPDVVSAALTDQAIETAGKKAGINKTQVVANLNHIRQIAVNAPRGEVEPGDGYKVQWVKANGVMTATMLITNMKDASAGLRIASLMTLPDLVGAKLNIQLASGVDAAQEASIRQMVGTNATVTRLAIGQGFLATNLMRLSNPVASFKAWRQAKTGTVESGPVFELERTVSSIEQLNSLEAMSAQAGKMGDKAPKAADMTKAIEAQRQTVNEALGRLRIVVGQIHQAMQSGLMHSSNDAVNSLIEHLATPGKSNEESIKAIDSYLNAAAEAAHLQMLGPAEGLSGHFHAVPLNANATPVNMMHSKLANALKGVPGAAAILSRLSPAAAAQAGQQARVGNAAAQEAYENLSTDLDRYHQNLTDAIGAEQKRVGRVQQHSRSAKHPVIAQRAATVSSLGTLVGQAYTQTQAEFVGAIKDLIDNESAQGLPLVIVTPDSLDYQTLSYLRTLFENDKVKLITQSSYQEFTPKKDEATDLARSQAVQDLMPSLHEESSAPAAAKPSLLNVIATAGGKLLNVPNLALSSPSLPTTLWKYAEILIGAGLAAAAYQTLVMHGILPDIASFIGPAHIDHSQVLRSGFVSPLALAGNLFLNFRNNRLRTTNPEVSDDARNLGQSLLTNA
jgi:hypothetical protein